jgi:protein-disulfide isomerase
MSIIYRIIVVLLCLAAAYSIYGIAHFKWMNHYLVNPKVDFLVDGNVESKETIVEFTYYQCGWCKEASLATQELLKLRKDLRHVIRPVIFGGESEQTDRLTKIALAAGLQGKFWEIHQAFIEYPELEIPDDFIEETALLYGIDYAQLIKDSNGKKVDKIARSNLTALEHSTMISVPSFVINNKSYAIENGAPDLKFMLTLVAKAEEK